jgi:hypothetical protein
MEDIHKDNTFFESSSFFLENKNKRQKNQLNVFQLCLLLIKDEKNKSFNFVYKNYQKEILFCLKSYFTEKEQSSINIDSKNWVSAIDIMLENNKHKFNQEPLNEFEIIQIKNTINSTAIIDAILLDNNLKTKKTPNNKRIKV